ncbi:unnamed protein product, partial [marine sediment metagenome]
MKVLLLNPPMDYDVVKKELSYEAYMPPLGLLYLASALEKKGHDIKVIDYVAESYSIEKLKNDVSKFDIIGITVASLVATSVRKVTDLIKQFFP